MRKWYFKKRVWIPALIFIVLAIYLYQIVFVNDIPITQPNVNHKAMDTFEIRQDTLHDHMGNELIVMELGRLVVPEDRSDSKSNHIEIYFERMKSNAANPLPPIFFLAGGPGSSATGIARTQYFYLFKELSRYADVILMDQRGTGNSIPNIECRNSLATPIDITENVQEQIFDDILKKCKECYDEFDDMDIVLRAYNSYESILDIEALRENLGYETLTLYGYSYGTELAQIYIKHFEQRVAKAILAAPLAPDHGLKLPLEVEYQYEMMDSLIKQDKRLSKYIPDYLELVKSVHQKLLEEPQFVQTSTRGAFGEDPSEGEKVIADIVTAFKPTFDMFLTETHLQMMLSDKIGIDRAIARLPSVYYNISQGNYEEVGLSLRNFSRRRMPNALFFTVNGSSGYTEARWNRAQAQEEHSFFTNFGISYSRYQEVYDAFGAEKIDGMNVPVSGQTNTLLIGGTLDGRTPPNQAEDIASRFPNHQKIIVENAGHNGLLNTDIMHGIIEFMQDSLKTDLRTSQLLEFTPPVPYKYSITDTITKTIRSKGIQHGIDLYHRLYKTYNDVDDYIFEFNIYTVDDVFDTLIEEKNYDEAIALIESTSSLFPETSQTFTNLGEAYHLKGDKTNALAYLQKAMTLDFFDTEAQALYRTISNN